MCLCGRLHLLPLGQLLCRCLTLDWAKGIQRAEKGSVSGPVPGYGLGMGRGRRGFLSSPQLCPLLMLALSSFQCQLYWTLAHSSVRCPLKALAGGLGSRLLDSPNQLCEAESALHGPKGLSPTMSSPCSGRRLCPGPTHCALGFPAAVPSTNPPLSCTSSAQHLPPKHHLPEPGRHPKGQCGAAWLMAVPPSVSAASLLARCLVLSAAGSCPA